MLRICLILLLIASTLQAQTPVAGYEFGVFKTSADTTPVAVLPFAPSAALCQALIPTPAATTNSNPKIIVWDNEALTQSCRVDLSAFFATVPAAQYVGRVRYYTLNATGGKVFAAWSDPSNPFLTSGSVPLPPPPVADTIPPTVTGLVARRSGNSSNYTVSVQATDNVRTSGVAGISRVIFSLNGTVQRTLTTSSTSVWMSDLRITTRGDHLLTAEAFDVAGNRSVTGIQVKR